MLPDAHGGTSPEKLPHPPTNLSLLFPLAVVIAKGKVRLLIYSIS